MAAHTPQHGLLFNIAAGVATGAALAAFRTIPGLVSYAHVLDRPLVNVLIDNWDRWLVEVALVGLAGGIAGTFCWILWEPRNRVTRGMLAMVGINWATWVAFLALTPPVETARFEEIAGQRAVSDRGGSIAANIDRPTILAARYFGGFRPIPPLERSLTFMAGVPAIMAEPYVVPARYVGSPPTRRESYVIAGIAFVFSTAFWATIGGTAGALWRRAHRRVSNRER